MAIQTRTTVEEVFRLADEGKNYEVVDGEAHEMSPTGLIHGEVEGSIFRALDGHVEPRGLGIVVVGEVLFRLDEAGTLARAADVAFIAVERVPDVADSIGAFNGAPDLAVEVICPGNSAETVQEKVRQWLDHGTKGILLVYGSRRSVVLWTAQGGKEVSDEEILDLDPIVPGFRCRVIDLFPKRLRK